MAHSVSSKHQRVLDQLRGRLADGHLPPGTRLPPETELHKQLKVGRQTLLHALHELVREGLLVRRRGSGTYVADRSHPPLILGRHLRLGILWYNSLRRDRLDDSFLGCMTQGALAHWGFQPREGRFTETSGREPTRAIWSDPRRGVTVEAIGEGFEEARRHPSLKAIREGGFDGLLALGILEDDWLSSVLDLGLPTVLVDYPGETFTNRADRVFVDSTPGYRDAVAWLASQGLRRIHYVGALISGPPPAGPATYEEEKAWRRAHLRNDPDSLLRQHAWRLAMDENGLSAPEGWVHRFSHSPSLRRKLEERFTALPEPDRPEAVVCADSRSAEMLHAIFRSRSWPLAAVGGAWPEYRGEAIPIRIAGRALGEAAASLLLARLQQPNRPFFRVGVPATFEAPAGDPSKSAAIPRIGHETARSL